MAFPRRDAALAFKRADALFRAGQYADAQEILAELNGMFPHQKNVLFPIALCIEKTGNAEQAIAICDQLISRFNDPRAVLMKARLREMAGSAQDVKRPPGEDATPEGMFGALFGEHKRFLGMATVTITSMSLILANLVPLAGAVFLKWDVFMILLTFWMENVVIGFFNILRMATAQAGGISSTVAKFMLIPFFAVHYSGFCLGHLAFLCMIFGRDSFFGPGGKPELLSANSPLQFFFGPLTDRGLPGAVYIAAAGLLASHAVSFFANFLWNGEYQRVMPGELMKRPYGRVVILHIAILAGGGFVVSAGSPQYAVAVLVLAKIAVDLAAHVSERRKFET